MSRWWVNAVVPGVALALATPLSAQGPQVVPSCKLDEGHYLLRSARTYLINASRTNPDPKQRERDLNDAFRVLQQAVAEGQGNRSGTWFWLGRYYIMRNDYAGVDSVFDRVEASEPECARDTEPWRRYLWGRLIESAVQKWQANQLDTAVTLLRIANELHGSEPQGYINLATLYQNSGEVDSAVKYLRLGVEAGGEKPEFADQRQAARLRLAVLYHRKEQHDSAATWYRNYLAEDSTNVAALSGLAIALTAQGKDAEAQPIYDVIIANAGRAEPRDLLTAGIALFNAKRYDAAAQAFEGGLAKLPLHRELLRNLANTYLSMKAGDKMLPVVQRLVEVDPLSKDALRLRAAAYQQLRQPEQTLKALEEIEAMPLSVNVLSFEPLERRAVLLGQVENHSQQPTSGLKLAFEFLDAKGQLVATAEVAPEVIPAGETADFRLAPEGGGIVTWRYKMVS